MIELLLQADRLLTVDMVDQAEEIYRRVIDADPRNVMAVVGLARCALAREDEQKAWELAAQALTIDPRNELAQRMEARLGEILAVRGDPQEGSSWVMRPPDLDSGAARSAPARSSAGAANRRPPRTPSRSLLDRLRGR